MKFLKRKKGFTLIEMVVVIAIIVIIASIAIPQALKAINKSKASTDLANARTYAGQIMSRIANNDMEIDELPVGNKSPIKEEHIGMKPTSSSLKKGKEFEILFSKGTDGTGNVKGTEDSLKIYIGDIEVYPEVETGSDWARYSSK